MGQINILSTDGTHKAGLSFTGTSDISVDAGNIASKTELNSKPTGFKNYIINGGFDVWQRGTAFTNQYNVFIADRWQHITSNAATLINASRSTDTPNKNIAYSLNYGATNTSYVTYLCQRIEDVRKIAGKTVTVSFYARATTALTLNAYIINNYGASGSTYESTEQIPINITTSWIKYTFTVVAPTAEGKTIGDNSFSEFGFQNPLSTAGIFIAQVQLEEGSVATPFENRPYGLELSLCQRYYEAIGHPFFTGRVNGIGISRLEVVFDVKKRTVPTLSSSGVFSVSDMYTADRLTINNPPITFSHITTRGTYFEIGSASINGGAFSNGSVIHSLCDNTTGVVSASAEL